MTKRLLIGAALLAVLAVGVLLLAATTGLLELRGPLAARLSAASGREVTIDGTARLRPGLPPGLHVEGLAVGGPAKGSWLREAHTGGLDLVLALWPLLRGELRVHALAITDLKVSLEKPVAAEETAASDTKSDWQVFVERVDVTNATLELRRDGDKQSAARFDRVEFRGDDDGLSKASAAGAFENLEFDLSLRRKEAPPSSATGSVSVELEGQVAGARVTGQGSTRESDDLRTTELHLQAQAPSLKTFSGVARRELPQLGPLRAKALLKVVGEDLAVSDLDLRVGSEEKAWLHLTGHAEDLRRLRHFALEAEFGFDDVRSLGPLVGDPPDIGAVAGKASVSDRGGTPGVDAFHLTGGRKGVFEIDAHGRFEDLEAVDGLDAQVKLTARDLAVVGELLRRELPQIGPVEFSGAVKAEDGKLDAKDLRARLDRTQFRGAVSGQFAEAQRPRIQAHLDVPDLYLDDVGIKPWDSADASAPATRAASRPGEAPARIFSAAPLDLGSLDAATAQASVHVDRVLGVGGPVLRDLQIDASLKDGWFSARHIAYQFDGGVTQGHLDFDTRVSPPSFDVDAHAENIELGRLFEDIDPKKAYSGRLHARLDLHTRGASPHELVAHLNGEVSLATGKGTIDADHAGLLTRDLIHALRKAASSRPARAARLNCIVGDFEFNEGVAEVRTLVLDSERGLITGDGSINLDTETVQMRLVPKPRKVSPFATAATVRVTGPLAAPDVKIVKGSLVTSTTAGLLKKIDSATLLRRAWHWLRGKGAPPTLCEKLLASLPSATAPEQPASK